MQAPRPSHRSAFILAAIAVCANATAQNHPLLTWITNSSVKVEQIIGDKDWANAARGITTPTASQTVTRFHILGNDLGCSFEDDGKVVFLFGDTISEDNSNLNFHAGDTFAWSTNTDATAGLLLNFYTNNVSPITNGFPLFVRPPGIQMGADDVPDSGFRLNGQTYLICHTGSDVRNPDPHLESYSVLVSFDETNQTFATNRTISMLNSNLDARSVMQGHFVSCSPRVVGTNVFIFGLGEYRATDVYLQVVPTNNLLSGMGTRYFAGMTNGGPVWNDCESNAVPVVADNPTNGPPWPGDSPTIGNVSVIFSTNLNLWLMTYDGGRQKPKTRGVYFCYAPEPWGPWSTPQLIFNDTRDHASGVFIHNPSQVPDDGLEGPTIGSNDPTNTAGGAYAPFMIERFTTVASNTLTIYYTLSTWNPYTLVRMRSDFTITHPPKIITLSHSGTNFTFSWSAPTNVSFRVDYSTVLPPIWSTFTNNITSGDGNFSFTDDGSQSGGLNGTKLYRVRAEP